MRDRHTASRGWNDLEYGDGAHEALPVAAAVRPGLESATSK
jgi:hypothetical protein